MAKYQTDFTGDAARALQQLGAILANKRVECHMSQASVAAQLQIVQSTVCRVEKGIYYPPPGLLKEWCSLFNLSRAQRVACEQLHAVATKQIEHRDKAKLAVIPTWCHAPWQLAARELGLSLRAERVAQGSRQSDVMERTGRNQGLLTWYETGKVVPKPDSFLAWLDALNITGTQRKKYWARYEQVCAARKAARRARNQ